MKVLFLSQETIHSNRDSVTYIFILKEMKALKAQGVDVKFLAFNESPAEVQGIPIISALSVLEKFRIHKFIKNCLFFIRNFDLYGKLLFYNLNQLLWRIQCDRAILQCIKKYDIDVVHTHFFVPSGGGGTVIKRYCHVPIIATCRGAEICNMPEYDYGAMRCRCFSKSLTAAIPYFDAITVPNRFYRETLLHTFPEVDPNKVSVLYNGVEQIAIANEQNQKIATVPTFISIGKLIKIKNHETLLQATKMLQNKFQFKVIIVGDGPLEKKLKEMIRELANNDVKLYPEVSKQNLYEMLVSSDCLVHPSFLEGGANVVLEALALGVPCIVSCVPSMHKEIIKEGINGFVFHPEKPSELAEKMEYVLLHREKVWEMKDACKDTVIPYSIEKKINGYLTLYKKNYRISNR